MGQGPLQAVIGRSKPIARADPEHTRK